MEFRCSLPGAGLGNLLTDDGIIEFSHLLVAVLPYAHKNQMWELLNLFCIGIEIDFDVSSEQKNPLLLPRPQLKRRRIDRAVADAVAFGDLDGEKVTNTGALSQVLSGIGVAKPIHNPERHLLLQYWLASRRHFDSCSSVNVALDAGSIAGKKWMFVVCQGVNSAGEIAAALAPPQVPDLLFLSLSMPPLPLFLLFFYSMSLYFIL